MSVAAYRQRKFPRAIAILQRALPLSPPSQQLPTLKALAAYSLSSGNIPQCLDYVRLCQHTRDIDAPNADTDLDFLHVYACLASKVDPRTFTEEQLRSMREGGRN